MVSDDRIMGEKLTEQDAVVDNIPEFVGGAEVNHHKPSVMKIGLRTDILTLAL